MKKFYLLGLIVLLCLVSRPAFAYDFKVGDLYYNIISDTEPCMVEVTYQEQESENNYAGLTTLEIPETVTYNDKTYYVVSIGESAFSMCVGLTSVTMPYSVERIEAYAFNACVRLDTITFSPNLSYIGDWGFYGCSSLMSVGLPSSVSAIGMYAFALCDNLASVIIPGSLSAVAPYAFFECNNLRSVMLQYGVAVLSSHAFGECPALTNIELPNSICYIDESAFVYTGLKSVVIPEKVESLGRGVFYYCEDLQSVTLPYGLKSIGENTFAGCKSLASITSYATEPPACYKSDEYGEISFGDSLPNAVINVPCAAIDAYRQATTWKNFKNFQCITMDMVDVPTDSTVVTPAEEEVTITWATVEGAETYTLIVSKDGETYCTLTFYADGRLGNIVYAPARKGQTQRSAAAETTTEGMRFTITGLESNTQYTYSVTAATEDGNVLHAYEGTFTTLSATPVFNPNADKQVSPVRKTMRNGQVLIQRGEEVYTLLGERL
ncbi:MAG: leucine-rich repeat protein [Paludibacteraceae bacterium]